MASAGEATKKNARTKHEIPLWRILLSSAVLSALTYIVVGVVLLAYPEVSYVSLVYIGAVAIMIMGLIDVVRYVLRGINEGKLNNYLSRGLILVLVSVFMFARTDYVIIVIPILLGLAIVIDGIIKLQRSVDLWRLKFEGWIFVLILAVLSLAIGAVLIFRPMDSVKALTMVTGIALIYCGITSVVVSIFVHLKLRAYREAGTDERPVIPMEEQPEAPAMETAEAPAMEAAEVFIEDGSQKTPAIEWSKPQPIGETASAEEQDIPEMPRPDDAELQPEFQDDGPEPSEAQMIKTQDGEIPFENIHIK
ncbi:MAG: DUF308 domain-containing protein [Firmicutes bacterium]|nr:DUF308 domain-containing protein [Bacillota bacterium]